MVSDGKKYYNYEEVLPWFEQRGKERFGSTFKIDALDYPILYKLLAYFLQDDQRCYQYGIDLNKGILLSGPIGCGKTTLMHLLKLIAPSDHRYSIKSCRDISFEFINEGYQIIHKYSSGKLYESNAAIWCFDDLGVENNLKYFGNECNVMAEVFLSRYDLFISRRLLTHTTTNLSASEIEQFYGNRVRSRMRQMFNLIAFDTTTIDKR